MKKLINIILKIKSYLPFNGDFLYVTENIQSSSTEKDISNDFDKSNIIIKKLKSNEKDILELTYKMSLDYYNSILDKSDKVREKAKVIVSSSSFISAVIIALSSSVVIVNKTISHQWLLYIEFILYLMTIMHLIRSLMIAITVIRREESIEISPLDIVEVAKYTDKKKLGLIYKEISSKMIAYANNTHEFIRKRVNQLILSQTSYKYGIFYFVLFMVLHVFILNLFSNRDLSFADLIKSYEKNQNIEIKLNEKQINLLEKFIDEYKKSENNKLKILKLKK